MNRTRLQASEGDESGYTPECYICDRRHFVKACPFMEVARLAVQDYIRQEKLMKKHNLKPCPLKKIHHDHLASLSIEKELI